MASLFDLKEAYPCLGRSLLKTFSPDEYRPDEIANWKKLNEIADAIDGSAKTVRTAA